MKNNDEIPSDKPDTFSVPITTFFSHVHKAHTFCLFLNNERGINSLCPQKLLNRQDFVGGEDSFQLVHVSVRCSKKAEVQELLKMPLPELLLLINYLTLVAALPIYATSPDLSVEKAYDLEELAKNLPSLLANFQEATKQYDECNKKAAEKVNLVNKLTANQEPLVAINASISNLKERLKRQR